MDRRMFERPVRFALAIDMTTARAFGITVALSLLQRADEAIQ